MANHNDSELKLAAAKLFHRHLQFWASPKFEREAEWLTEISALPRVTVTRLSDEVLLDRGMLPNDCHTNCYAAAKGDPSGKTRHVFGWIVEAAGLLCHSVLETAGSWSCPTPVVVPSTPTFEFIPDPEIHLVAGALHRRGVANPVVLRKEPAGLIELHRQFSDFLDGSTKVLPDNALLGRYLSPD